MVERKLNGLKLACAIMETVFAIPLFGAMVIVGLVWIPLVLSLGLHIVTLVLTKEKRKINGNVLGILAATVGIIPFVGWILHVLAAVFCWQEAFKER